MTPSPGLLLDFDGTLADSISGLRQAYQSFVTDHGGIPSDAEFETLNGPSLREIVARLALAHTIAAPQTDLLADYRARIQSASGFYQPAYGAEALLQAAQDTGYRIVIVTSGWRQHVRAWLDQNGLLHYFEGIIGAEDVTATKPAPQPYLRALSAFKCNPEGSLAVEDSRNGVTAAVSAGLKTYIIGQSSLDRQIEKSPLFKGRLNRLYDLREILLNGQT